MKLVRIAGVALGLLASRSVAVHAQEVDVDEITVDPAAEATVQPPDQPPQALPPAIPAQVPVAPVQQQVQAPPPSGQWVYTQQYGWVYMPYGDQFVSTPAYANAVPQAYLYYPSYGWTWVAAPWVWGWGVRPYFGVYGHARYSWYRPVYRPVYRGPAFRAYGGHVGSFYRPVAPHAGFHPGYGGGHGGGWRGGGGHHGGWHR